VVSSYTFLLKMGKRISSFVPIASVYCLIETRSCSDTESEIGEALMLLASQILLLVQQDGEGKGDVSETTDMASIKCLIIQHLKAM
jgi:hypothetical protein